MDEAYKIHDYLPVSYRNPEEQEYVEFLWSSFELNYKEGKYQFAFIAFHMLYMSAVYFNVWQIRRFAEEDFKKAMIGFGKDDEDRLMNARTPFDFSRMNERTVFRLFRLLGCAHDRIGHLAKSVEERNDSAHSNGQLVIRSQHTLDRKISKIIQRIEEIQEQSWETILRCYELFLTNSQDPEAREHYAAEDQVREVLIHENYMSPQDVEYCKTAPIDKLKGEPGFAEIENLHALVINVSYQ
jgi:hypothetical protein